MRCAVAFGMLWLGALTCSAAEPRLAGVMFTGVSSYTAEALLPLYRNDLGQPFDDALTARIARDLRARYDADGYLVPAIEPIRVDSGDVLAYSVRESAVRDVVVFGEQYAVDRRFWDAVTELKSQQPLRKDAFDAWLARVNRIEGIDVHGTMDEAADGQYVAKLVVSPSRVSGLVHVDNRAPEVLGRELMQAQVAYRYGETHTGLVYAGGALATDVDRLEAVSLGGSQGFDAAGSAFEWSYSRSKSRLPSGIANVSNDYDRARETVGVRTPLVVDSTLRADGWTSLQFYDVDEDDQAGAAVSRERVRALELGTTLSLAATAQRRHDVTLAIAHGLDAFGAHASEDANSDRPDLAYVRYTLAYQLVQQIGTAWSASLSAQGQATADHLPISERFCIGGRQLGGAFDPASVTGDQGIGARAELARYVSVSRLPAPVQVYAYYDYGSTRSNSERLSDSAASIGAGVRMGLGTFTADLELASPVQDPQSNPLADDGTRVFFALTQRFF